MWSVRLHRFTYSDITVIIHHKLVLQIPRSWCIETCVLRMCLTLSVRTRNISSVKRLTVYTSCIFMPFLNRFLCIFASYSTTRHDTETRAVGRRMIVLPVTVPEKSNSVGALWDSYDTRARNGTELQNSTRTTKTQQNHTIKVIAFRRQEATVLCRRNPEFEIEALE